MSDVEVPAPNEPLIGRSRPTEEVRCPGDNQALGRAAVVLAAEAGLVLDEWQQYLLIESMGIRDDGLWAAFEAAWIISRRNGKSTLLAARALAGLFLLGERDIVWSAHRYDTAMDGFKLMKRLIWDTPRLKQELARTRNNGISTTHGDESITLRTGQRIRFKTRTEDGGRGLDGDAVFIDEVQAAKYNQMSAMLPTLGARPNPQIFYAGSAGGARSFVLGDLVHRALKAEEDAARDRLYFAQWSADPDVDDPASPITWAKTNPSLGIRLAVETMAGFFNTWRYKPDYFFTEHLGVGNYPRPDGEGWIVPSSDWLARADDASEPISQLVLAVDASPDLQWASISLAGYRPDGNTLHMGLVAHEHGTRWTIPRLTELKEAFGVELPIVMDARSPMAYLLADLEQVGHEVRPLTSDEWADASAWFVQAGTEKEPSDDGTWRPAFTHTGQQPVTVALAAASVRSRGERFVVSRQAGDVDVSPLTSSIQAAFGVLLLGRKPGPPPAPELIETSSSGGWDRPDFAGMSF